MTALSPDQLQAIQAFLQQNLAGPDSARSVPVEIQLAAINIDNLSRLLLLEGKVIQASLDQILFRTAQGEFQLRLQQPRDLTLFDTNSPTSSGVTLQLKPGPNGIEAVLVLDGKSISDKLPAPSLSALSAPQTLTFEIPKAGQVFQATFLPSTLLEAFQLKAKQLVENAISQNQNQLPGGNNSAPLSANAPRTAPPPQNAQPNNVVSALFQRLGITPPENPVSSLAPALNLNALATGDRAAPQLSAALSSLANAATPQVTSLKVISVVPPADAPVNKTNFIPPVPINDDDGEVYTVTVRGQTPSGQTLVSLGDSLLAVKSNTNWPAGTQLRVALGPLAGLTLSKDGQALPPTFESLRQIMAVLTQHNPAMAAEIMAMRVPQPTPAQMPGALLFLFAALQKNSFNSWLGDEVSEKLRDLGRADLLHKLQEEGFTRAPAQDSTGTEWAKLTVPWYGEDKMQAFRFYINQHQHEKAARNRDDPLWARRFLIDMSLSKLGPVQLEGLVRKKKIELALRTDHPLPESLRNELRVAFHQTMEEVRYVGELRFQSHKTGWVEMKEKKEAGVTRNI